MPRKTNIVWDHIIICIRVALDVTEQSSNEFQGGVRETLRFLELSNPEEGENLYTAMGRPMLPRDAVAEGADPNQNAENVPIPMDADNDVVPDNVGFTRHTRPPGILEGKGKGGGTSTKFQLFHHHLSQSSILQWSRVGHTKGLWQ